MGADLWLGLERNDFSNWPSGIFARAFVRDYAKAVGLDADEIVDEFCRLFPIGDRRAINALIATHGVIFDTRTKTLWVSESPHLLGRFVAFDLARMLADDYVPSSTARLPAFPASLAL